MDASDAMGVFWVGITIGVVVGIMLMALFWKKV
jgi:hypothetical protein